MEYNRQAGLPGTDPNSINNLFGNTNDPHAAAGMHLNAHQWQAPQFTTAGSTAASATTTQSANATASGNAATAGSTTAAAFNVNPLQMYSTTADQWRTTMQQFHASRAAQATAFSTGAAGQGAVSIPCDTIGSITSGISVGAGSASNGGSGAASSNSNPTYVNAKQYRRILKRREARAKLEEFFRRQRQIKAGLTGNRSGNGSDDDKKRTYTHESRHRHAMKRPRGPGGRFLTKDELEEYYIKHPEEAALSGYIFKNGKAHASIEKVSTTKTAEAVDDLNASNNATTATPVTEAIKQEEMTPTSDDPLPIC
mmetsp:Transcript_12711/g.19165  ORF Transcript_12711/g.19165 Transcript_12711/m.19165 type:complete len:311 (+) Transcript_12711:156-1088(+)|eukprot:CAMPEP_0196809236 /NCGR_PEP_ID=MMETSP1362-20130617/9200_1 /TAXON_ID=163516 /ORGANISM="Leptocylindrus danicus, Strain CCMP1856" /LENGTH=310 /DNA_ID=CAMNT_0042183863 /DNA_START=102 /DNA_END=1034 /DNA_ORIENTATION=+